MRQQKSERSKIEMQFHSGERKIYKSPEVLKVLNETLIALVET